MDELLHHCLRELSFDGDLGCSITRLKDFIVGFSESSIGQNPDDAFCAFVWSLIVQHPTVQVGLKPADVTSEIWIAPQSSAKRKFKSEVQDILPSKLILIANAKTRPLLHHIQEHGDNLRIAIEPEAIYAAITGTHVRSSKLSPMVYTALQIITRGRDNGVSVVQLGQQTKYDQKTCFYLVKQLTELDLVVKVRRGGVGTHLCLHKYFYERNPSWKAIREEEVRAEGRREDKQAKDTGEDPESTAYSGFTPIDSRHLSSLPLVRARVVKLLQASKNNIHPSNNMLVTIGFATPTKTDRRFFQSRIRELLQQGVIEKVVVPSRRRKLGSAYVKCLRLVTDDNRQGDQGDGEAILSSETDERDEAQEGVKFNVTIHRQIVDLLEDAGTDGMTLQDLSTALSDFDKRTIELILTRAEKYPPPSHLKDLKIVGLMETSGRERRHRYFSTGTYRELLSKENFEAPDVFTSDDVALTGDFAQYEETAFYAEKGMLHIYQDSYKDKINIEKPRKRPLKNPILPDGRVKLGRPRKKPLDQAATVESTATRATGSDVSPSTPEAVTTSSPAKKRRTNAMPPPPADKNEDVVPQARKQGRPKGKQTSSPIVRNPRKRARSEEPNRDDEPRTSHRKRVKADVSTRDINSAVEQGLPGSTRPVEHTQERVGPKEKSYQQDKHEMTDSTSREDEPSEAPVSGLSGRTAATEANSVVPIDPKLLEDHQPPPTEIKPHKPPTEPITPSRGKVNVSHLRRENEINRVLVEQGGIVNIQSKEFYTTHRALIENLVKAGEATSAPIGTTLDKRTLATTLDSLERRGRIKQLKSSITSYIGVSRSVCIAYLPDVPQEKLNNFLAELSRAQYPSLPSDSYLKIDEQVEFGTNILSTPQSTLPLQLLQLEQSGDDRKERRSKNAARARQLFSYDNDTIRNVLLTERTTLSQCYGWIVGKAARARHLHLSTFSTFALQKDTPGIICHEHKIVDLSYYCHEIPLELFCSLISVLSYDEDLRQFMSTPKGRQTSVRNLPPRLHSFLQIGRSRARSRFLEILEVLWLLNLVVPLKPSTSEQPMISCAHGTGRHVFEPVGRDSSSSISATNTHTYWQFQTDAPIYLWAFSESSPPVWKHVQLGTEAQRKDYWRMLQEACTDSHNIPSVHSENCANVPEFLISLGRSLRRTSSWTSEHAFTWHQTQYMKQFIDVRTGRTPLQEENEVRRNSDVHHISWVVSAPEECVRHFYSASHRKLVLELERAKNRSKEKGPDKKSRATTEAKALLAKKAAVAKQQREQDWENLVSHLHPSPIPATAAFRLKRIRTRFTQAVLITDQEKWENEIKDALHEAELISRNLSRATERTAAQSASVEPRTSLNSEQSVDVLIALQGPALSVQRPKRKRKRKGDEDNGEKEVKPSQRRQRFLWNHDYDELARDASAIIRARCRGFSRLDWGAFEQVFPSVPRNTVRQRLAHIRESPGNDAYLTRLEERWHELWLQHRGTSALPDEDPLSPTNFDLPKHIDFLRTHIDKNALRVGFAQSQEKSNLIMPSSISELEANYIVADSTLSVPLFDFMWNATVEEGREKRLMHQSFTHYPEEVVLSLGLSSDSISIAEAALKMVSGTPHESYETERASNLLRSAGDSPVDCARNNLLARGVLSKIVRDPQKQKPGRQLKISEANQNAIGGPVSRDIFHDATALEELLRQEQGWREWPLLATDGDAATLMQAVSDNKVKFNIDTSQAQSARPHLDWNSKKADDDQIETAIFVKFDVPVVNGPLSPVDSYTEAPFEPSNPHPLVADGFERCCKGRMANGLVDCETCLQDEFTSIFRTLNEEEKEVARQIVHVVRQAGDEGIPKSQLRNLLPLDERQLFTIVHRLTDGAVPIMFWTGYSAIVLVHSAFLEKWTVIVSECPLARLHPRRWHDIEGRRIPGYWEAALRSVMGVVIFRPGITQHEIRWRLRMVYDRQEVNEILGCLSEEGYLHMRQKDGSRFTVLPLDDQEEQEVYWFVCEKAWYQM